MSWNDGYRVWLTEEQSLQNAQLVVNHFAGTDWTRESISALCGNMRHESSINPDMYEYGYDWSADRGYGLVQWTPRSKYWDWATARGLPQRNGDSQLARIDYEVENNIQWIPRSDYGSTTFAQFRQNLGDWSVEYLTEMFTWSYERPNQSAGESSMPDRKAFALRCYNELDFSGTGGVGVSAPVLPVLEGTPITSGYGWRIHPITGVETFHAGTDFGGDSGDPLFATQAGVVIDKGWDDIRGWYIDIDHDPNDPYFSRYQHNLEDSPLNIGDKVSKGQQVAKMGTTGSSTGVHLHFVIGTVADGSKWYLEEYTIDPEEYLQMTFGVPNEGGGVTKDKGKDLMHLMLSGALRNWS